MAESVDFFVSYTSADRPWAEWVAWELEQAGHSTIIQAWDMQPGSNFVLEMDKATRRAQRTIAVLSPAFVESPYCRAEWGAAFAKDPAGAERRLVPVRVREFEPEGLLGQIVYVDLVGRTESEARGALLAGVAVGRSKPWSTPELPDSLAAASTRESVPRPSAGAAVFSVPVSTRTFVGRTRPLERLVEDLAGRGAVAVHAIHGIGGVGKTQLAARYARTHRNDYDVIWWLRAEQSATLRADLAALSLALGLISLDADEQAASDTARGWLERHGRWLIVFDNARDPGAIADFVPEGDRGHVVITSRAHADWRALHARPLALDVWERQEALEFLSRRTDEHDGVVLGAVADALGDLPLALEQAAAYANRQAITLTDYLQRLHDRAPELFAAGRPYGYGHTVATVWTMAFEQIIEHPTASDLFGVCTYLAPDRIPRGLLDAWAQNPDLPMTARDVDDAIELMLGYALLTANVEQTLNMHRLVGEVARGTHSPDDGRRAATNAVTLLDRVLPDRAWEPERWPTCEQLVTHALTATQHATQFNVAPQQTARVLNKLGQYQRARAQLQSAREVTERALAINETFYGPNHSEVATTLANLGIVLHLLGESQQACDVQQRALAMKEAVDGPEHPSVATTLTNLGHVLAELGELERACDAEKRALALKEAHYGSEHPEVALTLGSLANVLAQLGQLEPARELQQRARAIQQAAYRPDHPELAVTLTNLGVVLAQLGELEEAREVQEHALAIQEAIYGPDHPNVAVTLQNLAIVLSDLGQLERTRELLQRALSIKEAVYGPNHPEVAITLTNVGIGLKQLGELERARDATQRALTIFDRAHGPEHPYSIQARHTLEAIAHDQRTGNRSNPEAAGSMVIHQQTAGVSRQSAHKARDETVARVSTTTPDPHPAADPLTAAALNKRYIKDLAAWNGLPWLKRKRVPRPQPPRGI